MTEKIIKIKSYFKGNSLWTNPKERKKLLNEDPEYLPDFNDAYRIDNLDYAKKLVPPFPRYYFWENVGKSYGIRQMGRTDGYNSVEELKNDQKFSFDELKISASPAQIWILKAVPVQKFEATI